MSERRRKLTIAGLVCVSSAAFVASFPPYRLPWLPWVAVVPLLLALKLTASVTSAAGVAAVWGLLAAYGITSWLPRAIATYYEQPFLLGLGLFVGTSILMGSFQYALFGAVYRRLGADHRPISPLIVAAAWVVAELGRCRLFGGNPWGLIGYTLVDTTVVGTTTSSLATLARLPVHVADLGGVYAVSFVVVAFNAALADVVFGVAQRRPRERGAWKRIVAGLATAAILVFGATAYGARRASEARDGATPSEKVAIVQGNVSLGTTWRADLYGRNFEIYLQGTADTLAERPRLVLWPENAMSFFADDEPLYRMALARTLAGTETQVLAGGPSHKGKRRPVYFNSAYLFDREAKILARYDKERLLPFAERFPFGAIAFLKRTFERVRELTPGTRPDPLPTVVGNAGVLICNEIMFAELAIARARAGATFLVNLSNDTWISDRVYSENHLAIGAMRAIETRRPVIRPSTSGPSAVIDATGRIVTVTKSGERAVLGASVSPSTEITNYVRFGDYFALVCAVAVGQRLLSAFLRGRRKVAP